MAVDCLVELPVPGPLLASSAGNSMSLSRLDLLDRSPLPPPMFPSGKSGLLGAWRSVFSKIFLICRMKSALIEDFLLSSDVEPANEYRRVTGDVG